MELHKNCEYKDLFLSFLDVSNHMQLKLNPVLKSEHPVRNELSCEIMTSISHLIYYIVPGGPKNTELVFALINSYFLHLAG